MGDFQPKRFQGRGGGKREVKSFAAQRAERPPAEVDATDAARAYAGEHGIDLGSVIGTGTGGRITKDDVVAVHEPPVEGEQPTLDEVPADEPAADAA